MNTLIFLIPLEIIIKFIQLLLLIQVFVHFNNNNKYYKGVKLDKNGYLPYDDLVKSNAFLRNSSGLPLIGKFSFAIIFIYY
jgi:hypothetical protein